MLLQELGKFAGSEFVLSHFKSRLAYTAEKVRILGKFELTNGSKQNKFNKVRSADATRGSRTTYGFIQNHEKYLSCYSQSRLTKAEVPNLLVPAARLRY
jgi:hypothetical protein